DSFSVSCKYPITIQNPDFLFELPKAVEESSGLVFFDGLLWTHNDSGGDAALYGIDTATGEISRRLFFPEIKNIDWEEVALHEDYLFIGDFGNNSGSRKNLLIYRVSRMDIPPKGDAELSTETIYFSFEDQTDYTVNWKSNNFDCEAMVAGKDQLYLFSKNRGDQQSKLYTLPIEPGKHTAKLVGRFDSHGLITGADYNSERNQLALVGYTYKTWKPFVWLFYGFENENFMEANKRRIDLPNLLTTQIEGVAFVNPWQIMISAERSKSFTARAFKMDLEPFLNPFHLALHKGELLDVNKKDIERRIFTINSDQFKNGDYRLVYFDKNDRIVNEEVFKTDEINSTLFLKLMPESESVKAVFYGKRKIYYCYFK
ncbi:MAG TPA: hypothetical protein PLC47_10415, partial [Bacteroidales bacterium]|nr:hypothetical protein [Bacteroidales bacterium]